MTRGTWRPEWFHPFIIEPRIPRGEDEPRRYSWTPVALSLTAFLTLGLQAATSIWQIELLPVTAGWAVLAALYLLRRPRSTPVVEIILTATLAITQAALLFLSQDERHLTLSLALRGGALACAVVQIIILVNMPMRDPRLSSKGISHPFTTPNEAEKSPEDNLTFWQWMSVSWFSSLLKVGTARKLDPKDVWALPHEFQHQHLHETFRHVKGTVVCRLLKANWIDLVYISILTLVELGGIYTGPLVLQKLLQAMQFVSTEKGPAIRWALVTLLLRYVSSQSAVFGSWYGRRAYERSRGEMITMIYEKTLHRKIQGGLPTEDEKVKAAETEPAAPAEPVGDVIADGDEVEAGQDQPLQDGTQQDAEVVQSRLNIMISRIKSLLRIRKRSQDTTTAEDKLPASTGKILNIMRNDVYEVSQRFWEWSSLIDQPLGLIISFSFVWRLLGWPCLFGIAVVVLAQTINAILAKILVAWETKRRKATDERLQKINQYIEAIRHLRYYAWQNHWLDGIMTARQKELNLRIVTALWDVAILLVNTLGSGLLPVASFWAYTKIKGDRLTVDIAFPALQLFSLLQSDLRSIPRLITVLLNAAVAVRRIEAFMQEPDKDESEAAGQRFGDSLETKDASFSWPGKTEQVLENVTVAFPKGLTVIYGPVASGKTALLQALLGELDLQSGLLVRPSSAVAYCSQTPWLQSMTIRDNILFNAHYDDTRYKETLHACALIADFAAFEHGDLSPIGENGIGLSGGQKMRVALARAVYSRADTLLLDDPLSALDQQTAEHIVRHCFTGAVLKDRTVILVTHRVDLCAKVADQFVEVTDGKATIRESLSDEDTLNALSPTQSRQVVGNDDSQKDGKDKRKNESIAVPEKFEEDEQRADGNVQIAVYWQYIKAGRLYWWAAVFTSSLIGRLFVLGQTWYLKEWSEAYKPAALQMLVTIHQHFVTVLESTPISRLFDRFPDPAINPTPWLLGLLILVVVECILFVITMGVTIVVTYVAGKKLFKDVMVKVSRTTFRYYDVTPVGRLMNRLTSDMGTVDGRISDMLMYTLWQIVSWTAAVSVIAFVTPAFLIAVVLLTLTFVYIFSKFIPTSQSLRRLEMTSLSPLMSNFGALLEGLMTVRAFCAQEQFQHSNILTVDAFQRMDHFYWSLQTWLMFRFDLLSAISTLILTLLAIYSDLAPGLTAFVLISAGKFVQSTHALCKSYGRLQLDFVAVERVVELLDLEDEPPGTIIPPASWPSTADAITFESVTIRYAPHLEPAVADLSLTIPGGSSTAIVGRTGSGKSTLALALLATTPLTTGRILIGNMDIHRVSKSVLRERITFLAQDPVLFPGTLRHNLDPLGAHTDEEVAAALRRTCSQLSADTLLDAGGKNLSQGQRQLVGLARAVLRRSAVVVMDEATASVDRATAWEVQRVLREELAGSTVVTIAHRQEAVRGCDLVLRMKGGRVEGFGPPELEEGSAADAAGG